MLAMVLAMMVQAGASTGTPLVLPNSVTVAPDWQSRATAADLMSVYPIRALQQGVAGAALVACKAQADGRLAECLVEREAPSGFGFARAALALMPRFVLRSKAANGKFVVGEVVRVPIQFQVEN